MAGYLEVIGDTNWLYVAGAGTNENVIKKIDGSGDMGINSSYVLTNGRKIRGISHYDTRVYVICDEDETGVKEPKVIRFDKNSFGANESELLLTAIGGYSPENVGECKVDGSTLWVGGSVLDGTSKHAALWKINLDTFAISASNHFTDFQSNRVYEDLEGFTVVDPDSRFTKWNHNVLTFDSKTNEDSYFYKDYSTDHFGNFTHKIKMIVVSTPDDGSKGYVWLLANALDDVKGLHDASATFIGVYFTRSGSDYKIILHEDYSGIEYEDSYITTSGMLDDDFYLKITKSGTNISCVIYGTQTDLDNGTNPIDTLSLTLQANHSFRYLFTSNTFNDGVLRSCTIKIENLTIGELNYNGKISAMYINSTKIYAITENGTCLKIVKSDLSKESWTYIIPSGSAYTAKKTINFCGTSWADIHWINACSLKHLMKIRTGVWGIERHLADTDPDWTSFNCAVGGGLEMWIGAGNCNEIKKVELTEDIAVLATLTLSSGTNGINAIWKSPA